AAASDGPAERSHSEPEGLEFRRARGGAAGRRARGYRVYAGGRCVRGEERTSWLVCGVARGAGRRGAGGRRGIRPLPRGGLTHTAERSPDLSRSLAAPAATPRQRTPRSAPPPPRLIPTPRRRLERLSRPLAA